MTLAPPLNQLLLTKMSPDLGLSTHSSIDF